jgi:hypothetical protein
MGQVTKLLDITQRLSELDSNGTIYAAEPWRASSDAVVCAEPISGGLPVEASEAGMTYFLEVHIAYDFVGDWIASLGAPPDPVAICQRLIDYATNDT